jgi:hypothetical protein
MKTKLNILTIFVLLAALVGGTASTAAAQETNYISWSPAAPQEGGGWVYFTTTYPATYVTKKWERSTNPGGTACDQEIGWDDTQSEFWQSGDYLICLTIYPTWNFEDAISYTRVMTVTNLPPEINQIYSDARGGLYYYVTAEARDWDSGITCAVDYGDGTGPLDGEYSGYYCYGPDHEFPAEGTYDVVITLNEPGFDPVSTTHSLNVVNNIYHVFNCTPALPMVGEDVTFGLTGGDPPPGYSFLWTRSSEPGGTACDATIGAEIAPITSFDEAGDFKVCLVMSYDGEPIYYDSQVVTVNVPSYQSGGFTSPVDLGDVINLAKAGQMIPLKWMLLDASGAPVTDLDPASVTITVSSFTCQAGVSTDAIEVYVAGGSGLQNLGDGYYQYNWKTLKTYANSCRQLTLNIGTWSGSGFTAKFQFKK